MDHKVRCKYISGCTRQVCDPGRWIHTSIIKVKTMFKGLEKSNSYISYGTTNNLGGGGGGSACNNTIEDAGK